MEEKQNDVERSAAHKTARLATNRPLDLRITAQCIRGADGTPASDPVPSNTVRVNARQHVAPFGQRLVVRCRPNDVQSGADIAASPPKRASSFDPGSAAINQKVSGRVAVEVAGFLRLRLTVSDAASGAEIVSVETNASEYLRQHENDMLMGTPGLRFGERMRYEVNERHRTPASISAAVPKRWYSGSIRLKVRVVSAGKDGVSGGGGGSKVTPASPGGNGAGNGDNGVLGAGPPLGGPIFEVSIKRVLAVCATKSDEAIAKELRTRRARQRKVAYAFTALVLFLVLGMLAYPALEGWAYLDSLWFGMVTVTTVGYGDFCPETQGGRLFTAFFVLIGVGMIGVALGIVGEYFVEEQKRIAKDLMNKAQAIALNDDSDSDSDTEDGGDDEHDGHPQKKSLHRESTMARLAKKVRPKLRHRDSVLARKVDKTLIDGSAAAAQCSQRWLRVFLPVLVALTVGLLVMLVGFEVTDDDNGASPNKANCTDLGHTWYPDSETCGVPWTFVDGLYWGVVTGTTVGYGDLGPERVDEKWFGLFFLVMSVVTMTNALSTLGSWVMSLGQADTAKHILKQKLDRKFLLGLDEDGNGEVSEYEYLTAMLLRLKFVEPDDIDMIMRAFHRLDIDGSGTLSVLDLASELKSEKLKRRGSSRNLLANT